MSKIAEGYKQTEVGIIPRDWEVKKIEDFSIKVGSGITPTGGERVYKKEGRPFLRSQNVGWGTLILDDIAFIDDNTHNTFNSTEIQENDVFLNITGASIGRSAMADNRVLKGNVNQHVCIIRVDEDKTEPRFLNYFLMSFLGQKQISNFQAGGNRQGLNFGQIKSIQIPLPPTKAEQTAIATALNDADALITQLEKLIAKKRNIKQGAMQELLRPKVGWKVKRLGEILKSAQLGGNYPNSEKCTAFPLIKMGNIQRSFISTNKIEYIIENYKAEKKDRLKYGDLLFNTRNTLELVGKVSIWRNELQEAYFNSNLMRLEFNPEFVSSNFFMNYMLNTQYSLSRLKDIATGTTSVAAIYTRDLVNIEIPLPKIEEQTHIGQILSDMDAEIEALEKKLEKYKMLKQGMMQNLLTGKIRLV